MTRKYMNGKGVIVTALNNKIEHFDSEGCGYGKLTRQEIDMANICMSKIEVTLEKINEKFNWGIVVVIILAFFAGVNALGTIKEFFH